MRLSSNQPPDPEIQADLDAIDATLRGEAVLPACAELAEVALILVDERPPPPREEFVRELDARVVRRFQPEPVAVTQAAGPRRRGRLVRRLTAGTVALAAVAGTVIVIANGSGGRRVSASTTAGVNMQSSALHGSAASSGANASAAQGAAPTKSAGAVESKSPSTHRSEKSSSASVGQGTYLQPGIPMQNTTGRKIEQSTEIQLSTGDDHIDAVAQEIFNVASAENVIVQRSHVSSAGAAAGGGLASFTLSVPDSNLQTVMSRLSSLTYAHVVSRQQSSEDVTNQYNDDQRALADQQALRSSLIKQLASAYTTGQIDSLKAQIQSAENNIQADERQLNSIEHATSYTPVSVQVNGVAGAARPASHASSGFSVGRGAHDALRVLVVAAGVALIVLAALIPIALLVALIAWIVAWVRNRRREHALNRA